LRDQILIMKEEARTKKEGEGKLQQAATEK